MNRDLFASFTLRVGNQGLIRVRANAGTILGSGGLSSGSARSILAHFASLWLAD